MDEHIDEHEAMSCAQMAREVMHAPLTHEVSKEAGSLYGGTLSKELGLSALSSWIGDHVGDSLGPVAAGVVTDIACQPAELGAEGGKAIGHTINDIYDYFSPPPPQVPHEVTPMQAPDVLPSFAGSVWDTPVEVVQALGPATAVDPSAYAASGWTSLPDFSTSQSSGSAFDVLAATPATETHGHASAFDFSTLGESSQSSHASFSAHEAASSHDSGGTSHGGSPGAEPG